MVTSGSSFTPTSLGREDNIEVWRTPRAPALQFFQSCERNKHELKMMIPAYNKKECADFLFETGIHYRRKTDFFPEEDTTMSYLGFKLEPTWLLAEGNSHHTGWATA
ncbi:hypothetical protein TNCV_2364171 [Trichonephila clavipes]|nr:hypothetical protein TNCV_2364171 [Trichonephila clavipes]